MGSEDFTQLQKAAAKRSSKLEDEEMMSVLGHSQRRSNDAVPIARPGNRRTPYKLPGGSVQPMNTLTMSRNLPDQTYSSKPSVPKGKQQMLVVDVSRGYNVADVRQTEVDDSFELLRSAKRRKTIHAGSKSPESSDSTINELPPDQITFGRQSKQNTSPHAQPIGARKRIQQSMDTLDEYRNVEGMMDSNPRNAKRNKAGASQKSTSPLIVSLSRNNSVEMIGEGEHMATPSMRPCGSRYQGTLRKQPEMAERNGSDESSQEPRAKGTSSPYFKPRLPDRPTENDRSLRNTFVATDGRTRGTDCLSSDELDGPATCGEHADFIPLSPSKRHQVPNSKSPTSPVEEARSSPQEAALERSNIRPTVFHTQAPRKGRSGRPATFEDSYLDESKPPWAIPVAAIIIPGQKELHKSLDMAIVFDEEKAWYFVKDGGRALQAPNGSILGLYPKSLLRCCKGKSGRRIRFESSKRGTEDHVLDLEFMTEKDAIALLLKIQEGSTNVKVTYEDDTKLQKMFEVRRNQQKPTYPVIEGLENMPEDVQMAARNQQRQEAKDRQAQEASNIKRRRKKITDGLTNDISSENAPAGVISSSTSLSEVNGPPSRTAAKVANKAPGRSGIFDKIRPAHNDHLRRSARTSSVPSRFLEELEEAEQPKAERYSMKYGLGERWSKPLSYPRTGKKKATVEWKDLERLDEGEFLNDNLVSFYMRFLEEELANKDPDLAKTVYFFNSFFYDRLTTNQKGQKGINYEGVQRWTRGVDLFAYDFIIVPINELTHWYVAIICNLPALSRSIDLSERPLSPAQAANRQIDGELQDSLREGNATEPEEKEARRSFAEMSLDGKPHKRQASEDSLLGSLNQAKEGEKAIPNEEDDEMLDAPGAVEKATDHAHSMKVSDDPIVDIDDVPISPTLTKKQKRKSLLPSITKFDPSDPSIITFDSFGNPHSQVIKVLKQYLYEEGKAKRNIELDVGRIKGITAKNVPQQSNFSDCGLFMLGYVEKFLQDGPREFIAKIIRREYDDKNDWPKMVPSTMRSELREQLQKLHEEDLGERRAGKCTTGPQAAKAAPTVKERVTTNEAVSEEPLDSNAEALPMIQRAGSPVDVQQIRNLTYVPTADTEDNRSHLASKPDRYTEPAEPINQTLPNDSLIVIESQTQPEVASKEEQPDVPSSQPPKPLTPGHSMTGSLPALPSEIEDSQPSQQFPIAERDAPSLPPRSISIRVDNDPEHSALSPDPPSKLEEQNSRDGRKQTDQLHSKDTQRIDETPPSKGDSADTPPSLPKRRGRKGVAQKVTTPSMQQARGEKMTKEEAIVLDDD